MKKRLDILVTERGLVESREKAKTLIMAGQVYVDGQKADKPGDTFSEDAAVEVRGKGLPYVSRGGLKLEKRCGNLAFSFKGAPAWISAPPLGGLRTACCKTARRGSTRWMWATASSLGACVPIPGW